MENDIAILEEHLMRSGDVHNKLSVKNQVSNNMYSSIELGSMIDRCLRGDDLTVLHRNESTASHSPGWPQDD